MKYDAIMFDLDGTLADTLRDIAATANFALSSMGKPTYEVARYRYLAGQGLESLMTEALGPADAALVPRGMELFKQYYAEHSMDFTKPYDGMAEALDAVMKLPLKTAVLSNKPHHATLALMEKAFSKWRWDMIVGHREGYPLKPDPTSAIEVAEKLSVKPSRWIYVGDTKVDMATAVGAGMFAVGVTWGFRDEPELRESGAAAIIHHPSELLKLLD